MHTDLLQPLVALATAATSGLYTEGKVGKMPRDRKEHPKLGEKADAKFSEMPLSSLDPSYQYLLLQTRHEFAKGSSWAQAFPHSVSPRLKNGHYPNWEPGGICLVPWDACSLLELHRERDARVGNRPSKQNLLENSSSYFVKPIIKGLSKISPLYPALKFEPA